MNQARAHQGFVRSELRNPCAEIVTVPGVPIEEDGDPLPPKDDIVAHACEDGGGAPTVVVPEAKLARNGV